MGQAGFAYDTASAAEDAAGLPLAISIYADRESLRLELAEDAQAVGLRPGQVAELDALLDGEAEFLGDLILLDCPEATGKVLASLARLDMRAARTGAQLIVSTSIEGLDGVFGSLEQCNSHILVAPTRGQRVIALGDSLTKMSTMRLHELSNDDRLTLLRLTEQVGQMAERLERLSDAPDGEPSAFRFESAGQAFNGEPTADVGVQRQTRIALPDPRLVRQIIRQRQTRAQFFDGELFADPAWDMLLDLTAARAEHKRVSVTSLCIASGVPPTTALRWIAQMVDDGVLDRVQDDTDRRRAFIALSEGAADAMARYFAEIAADRHAPV